MWKRYFCSRFKWGFEGTKKCLLGNNYCKEYDEESKLFKVREVKYFPDENDEWSYANNCDISDHGEFIKCKDNFKLIVENIYLIHYSY